MKASRIKPVLRVTVSIVRLHIRYELDNLLPMLVRNLHAREMFARHMYGGFNQQCNKRLKGMSVACFVARAHKYVAHKWVQASPYESSSQRILSIYC